MDEQRSKSNEVQSYDRESGKSVGLDEEKSEIKSHQFQPGQSGNLRGRPKGSGNTDRISEDDRSYFGNDSRKFLERALAKAKTWEEGLKFAKELRMLQHPSLQSVQTKTDTAHTITLRWSKPEELPSNEKTVLELSVDTPIEEALPDGRQSDDHKEER